MTGTSKPRCSDIRAKNIDDLTRCGVNELTRPYGKGEIAKIIVRIALGRGKPKRDREYICSELVYECFANAGKENKLLNYKLASEINLFKLDDFKFASLHWFRRGFRRLVWCSLWWSRQDSTCSSSSGGRRTLLDLLFISTLSDRAL